MKRSTIAPTIALLASLGVAANAQPGPDDAASSHAAQHQAAKEGKKADLATARTSTDAPQNTAASLLEHGYLQAGFKRYRTELLTAPGDPLKVDGQFVFVGAPFNPDNERTSLYIQLLRMIGKATRPPSAAKIARRQQKATADLVALANARGSGQPVPAKFHPTTVSSTTAASTANATPANDQASGRLSIPMHLVIPTANVQDPIAAQSVAGVIYLTNVPAGTFISDSFNSAQIDYADPNGCASGMPGTNSDAYRDAILKCFAHAVHNLRVQAAQDAIREYQKWQHDPYGFVPPAGFTYSAPARPASDGHGHSLSIAGAYSAEPASAPDVRAFGEADAVDAFIGGETGRTMGDKIVGLLETSNSTDMPLLRAAMGEPPTPDPMKHLEDIQSGTALYNQIVSLVGSDRAARDTAADAGGGLAGEGVMSAEPIYDAILPYAKQGFWDAASETFKDGVPASEAEAGPVGLMAAFVTTMIEAGVDEGVNVFGNRDLPGDLQNELATAKAAPDPTAAELAGSQSGRTELFTVFVGGAKTLSL